MNLAHFYSWYALGSLAFCGALVFLGVAAGDHIDSLTPLLHKGGLLLAIVAVLAMVAIWLVIRARSSKRQAQI